MTSKVGVDLIGSFSVRWRLSFNTVTEICVFMSCLAYPLSIDIGSMAEWSKAQVSSEAWVQIPLLPIFNVVKWGH